MSSNIECSIALVGEIKFGRKKALKIEVIKSIENYSLLNSSQVLNLISSMIIEVIRKYSKKHSR